MYKQWGNSGACYPLTQHWKNLRVSPEEHKDISRNRTSTATYLHQGVHSGRYRGGSSQWSVHSWYSKPSQRHRSYQGETHVVKSLVLSDAQYNITCHFMTGRELWKKKKLNDLQRQMLERKNSWRQAKHEKL